MADQPATAATDDEPESWCSNCQRTHPHHLACWKVEGPPEPDPTTTAAPWSHRSHDEQPWRPGRKVGRTIYAQAGPEASDEDVLIGVMDTEWYAEITCRDHNTALGPEGVPGVFFFD